MPTERPSRGLRQSLVSRINKPRSLSHAPFFYEGIAYPTTDIRNFNFSIATEPGDRVTIVAESITSEPIEGAALFEIRALTSEGTRVAIPEWGYRSSRIQEFQYLTPAEPEKIAVTELSVPIPSNTIRLELIGRQWKRNVATAIVGTPIINKNSAEGWVYETDTGAKLEFPAHRYFKEYEIAPTAQRLQIAVNHIARGSRSSGPLAVKFADFERNELMPTGELAQHATFGSIILLEGEAEHFETTVVELQVPSEAGYLSIEGLDWASKTANIVGDIDVRVIEEKQLSIEEFIESIPPGDELFVIDTTAPPMGHETLSLRPNNLSLAAIARSHWVVFLPFSSLQEYAAHPYERLYQVPRSDIDRLWNALRKHRRGTKDTYVCSSFPSFEAITTAHDLRRLGWKIIYEVRDDMEEFNRVGYSKWYRPILEQKMLAIADKVVSVSRALDEKMVVMQPKLGPHKVIPNGVRQSVIDDSAHLRSIEKAAEREQSKVVGYVGHLTESWFDWPIVLSAANALPEVTFEIVGHGMPVEMDLPTNVSYLGPKTHEELLEIVERWKIGLIPFKDIPLTHSVDPNKIYEYFAWGLRCVTVQMGMVETYPWTKVYHDLDSLVHHIRTGLEVPVTEEDLHKLQEFVETMSWNSRMDEMLSFIGAEK